MCARIIALQAWKAVWWLFWWSLLFITLIIYIHSFIILIHLFYLNFLPKPSFNRLSPVHPKLFMSRCVIGHQQRIFQDFQKFPEMFKMFQNFQQILTNLQISKRKCKFSLFQASSLRLSDEIVWLWKCF